MLTQLLIGVTSKTHYQYPHEPAAQWHQTILDAFKQKDMDTAERKLTEHLIDGCDRAISALSYIHAMEN